MILGGEESENSVQLPSLFVVDREHWEANLCFSFFAALDRDGNSRPDCC